MNDETRTGRFLGFATNYVQDGAASNNRECGGNRLRVSDYATVRNNAFAVAPARQDLF